MPLSIHRNQVLKFPSTSSQLASGTYIPLALLRLIQADSVRALVGLKLADVGIPMLPGEPLNAPAPSISPLVGLTLVALPLLALAVESPAFKVVPLAKCQTPM